MMVPKIAEVSATSLYSLVFTNIMRAIIEKSKAKAELSIFGSAVSSCDMQSPEKTNTKKTKMLQVTENFDFSK